MKTKLLAFSALALVGLGSGIAGLSQVHAQSTATIPSTVQSVSKAAPDKEVQDANEISGVVETSAEKQGVNGVDADGLSGHQDPEGVDVQSQGGK